MSHSEIITELLNYLKPRIKKEIRIKAMEAIFHVIDTENRLQILQNSELLKKLVMLIRDECVSVAKHAASCIVNLTTEEYGINEFVMMYSKSNVPKHEKNRDNVIQVCMKCVMDKESPVADMCCMILSNVTRSSHYIDHVIRFIESIDYGWNHITSALTNVKYNNKNLQLDHLGSLYCNLSQSEYFRNIVLSRENLTPIIKRLLPFTEYERSSIRRRGVVATLKNCCFDEKNHEWLLSDEVNILPALLLPLAGPEEFDDEDNDKLPIELQYLPETKTREDCPMIKIMLLEALMQLCATKSGREILREKNAYVILREYHKWEKDEAAKSRCEDVVDILIKTEEEIGLDNLKEVDVPAEYAEKFKEKHVCILNQ